MKAIITMELEKPTRLGNSVIEHKIYAKKAYIEKEVNDFIYERQRRENFIRVLCFDVKILNYKKKVIKEWQYMPTYNN